MCSALMPVLVQLLNQKGTKVSILVNFGSRKDHVGRHFQSTVDVKQCGAVLIEYIIDLK